MESKSLYKKYIGTIYWITPPINTTLSEIVSTVESAYIPRAIMNDNEFKLGWRKRADGGIILKTDDKLTYTGQFSYESEGRVTGSASAQIYFNDLGCILIGIWKEEGESYSWIAELKLVDKFADEKN